MKRRKFILSAGLAGISASLLGNNLFRLCDDNSYWNYPSAFSPKEISHIQEMANTMLKLLPTNCPNKKKWVRNCLEPLSLIKKEETAEGYRIAYKNKIDKVVFILEQGGKQITQFA